MDKKLKNNMSRGLAMVSQRLGKMAGVPFPDRADGIIATVPFNYQGVVIYGM
jgi:hypothetical protein